MGGIESKHDANVLCGRSIGQDFPQIVRQLQNPHFLAVHVICRKISCDSDFPFISIKKQLFFIINKLFVSLSRELKVWSLNNSVDGTGLLAVTAVDTFGHVNVVSSSLTTAI